MNLQFAFWCVLAVVMLVVVPIIMVRSMVDHFRDRGSDRKGSGSISAGIGAACQELDRLIACPSIEHQVESENRVLKREDDNGDGE